MSRRVGGSAGFTLIEALVAVGVLAAVVVVAQRGVVAARLGLERAQSTLAAEAVARGILETELDRLAPAPGETRGVTDGLEWSVTAEPLDLPLPPAPPPRKAIRTTANEAAPASEPASGQTESKPPEQESRWRALRVIVSVANGRGRPLTVETVHLAKEL